MAITAKIFALFVLGVASVASQVFFDASRAHVAVAAQPPEAELIRAFDLGLHSSAASFLWLDVRTELPFLRQGPEHFLAGLKLVNDLAPRWSTPYAFSVLVLPNLPWYKDGPSTALAVGEKGLAEADPNWQIPFYMGAIYQLELNDRKNAAKYFDLAAATPGVPELVRRFAINYGIHPESIATTKAAWSVIYETSPDPVVRERAAAHIAHLEILEYLNAAVQAFKKATGRYPVDMEEVVRAGLIPSVPEDPFGFKFKIYGEGVVGIAPEPVP
jgi:hypothetical protein